MKNEINKIKDNKYSVSEQIDNNKKVNFKYNILALLLIVGIFYCGVAWGKHLAQPIIIDNATKDFIQRLSSPKEIFKRNPEAEKINKVDFNIFWKVWKKVDEEYVDKEKLKDTQKRVFGAVKGMVASLGDPYSSFLDPEESKIFNTELDGKFTGIGAEITVKDGILTVVAPIGDMPAEKAGIRAGDKIVKINGELTSDLTVEQAVKKIRGEKGSRVTLTVLHNKVSAVEDIEIVRDEIDIKSVVYENKENGIAYVRIKGFMDDTDAEFEKIVSQILADKKKGIILDVRSNPGGNLEKAIKIISKFIPTGEVILYEQDRNKKETAYRSVGDAELKNMPVIVLIDGGSASASEILAGALRDDRDSLLIGTKTFGKGLVQSLEPLENGTNLKITIAKWLTPSKQYIHEVGIKPTIKVELSLDDIKNKNDKQLQRALVEMKKQLTP